MFRESIRSKSPTDLWAWAATALGRIAPGTATADEAITALTEAFQIESQAVHHQAIEALTPFGPTDKVISALTDVLDSESVVDLEASIKALQQLGPKAGKAIPQLRELRKHSSLSIRHAADRALASLDPEY